MSNKEELLFEHLALKYMDDLYSKALRLVKSATQAEDLVQSTYQKAYQLFDKRGKGNNFQNWIYTILKEIYYQHNICLSTNSC